MKHICILSLAVALILNSHMGQAASPQSPVPLDLVKQAIAAQGGVDALRSIKGVHIAADVTHWEPEESNVAGGEPRFVDHSTFTVVWDLEKGAARTD